MSEIHGATGSYALNALDPSQLDEFEAHLAVCPTCSQEVVEFCETAAELSLLSETVAPPPALKASIMAAISEVRVLPPVDEPATGPVPVAAPPARPPVRPATRVAAVEHQPQRAMVVDELADRRRRRQTRLLSLAVAAAMVVALSLGGWVISLKQQQQGQVASVSAETQLYRAPDVKVTQFTLKNGAQASFVASKSLNKALLTSTSLPSPGDSLTYQLWTLKGQTAIADNTLGGGTGISQWFRGDIASATAVALSIEKAPGASSPDPDTIQKVAAV